MTDEELEHNHIKEIAENYVNESWETYLDLSEVDLVMACIGVAKSISKEKEKHITELEKEKDDLQKENAKLKARLNAINLLTPELEKQSKAKKQQLTKAKVLLAKWVELFKPKGGNIPPTPIQIDTEEFIKENEE